MSELMRLVIALLRSGSDEGCDSLVVVDRKEFIDLRVYVAEKTGTWYGGVQDGNDIPDYKDDTDE